MSIHVLCLTSGGGIPIFIRKKGQDDPLPYSVIGSLNGVHMFSKSHGVEILQTATPDHNIVWREFHDSVVLIAISTGTTSDVLDKLLKSVFNAMVLIVSLDEIKAMKNVERLKRDLKPSYPIIDRLLDAVDYGDGNKHTSDLVMLTETILCPENYLLQSILDAYAESVDTLFSCILIRGKMAVGTESWWSLDSDERKLLNMLGSSEHDSTAKDVFVYLPNKSPNVAFRLVSCTLIPDVVVCSLCGPTPGLEEIEQNACQMFKTNMEILRSAEEVHPRNFPHTMQLEAGILGILLINVDTGKYVLSRNPQQNNSKRNVSGSHRLDILRTFYYRAVGQLVPKTEDDSTVASETYWCSEYHKCHAARVGSDILCLLYVSSIPTHAMRLITQKTLKVLTSDKQVCW